MNISAIIIVQSNHSKFVIIISLTRNATYKQILDRTKNYRKI